MARRSGFPLNTMDSNSMTAQEIERLLGKINQRILSLSLERDRHIEEYNSDGRLSHLVIVDFIDAEIKKLKGAKANLRISDLVNINH